MNTYCISAWSTKESKVPKTMLKNHSDYEPLKLDEKEINALKEINKNALENQYE